MSKSLGVKHVSANGQVWYTPDPNADPSWVGGLDPKYWTVAPNGEGGYQADRNNKFYDYGIPLAIGSIFGYGAFGPGGYAAIGGGGGGADGAAGGAGTGAKLLSTGSSLIDWAKILGPIAGGLFGANMQAGANDKAAQIQADSLAKALALQKQMYEQDRADALAKYTTGRADFAPYLAGGTGAMTRLSDLVTHSAPPAMPGAVQGALNTPAMSTPAFSSPSNDYLQPGPPAVTIVSPTGQRKQFAQGDPMIQVYLQSKDRNGQSPRIA